MMEFIYTAHAEENGVTIPEFVAEEEAVEETTPADKTAENTADSDDEVTGDVEEGEFAEATA